MTPCCSSSSPGNCLSDEGLQALVWRLEDIHGRFTLLPEAHVDFESVPDDRLYDKADWAISIDIVLQFGGGIRPPSDPAVVES